MKLILALNIFLVFLVTFSNCASLNRRKRFLTSIWSSAKPKSANNEVVYLHLPPEYIEAMHHELQSRSDASQNEAMDIKPQQVRFMKPTKMMAILKPDGQSQNPKIIMKPILPRPEVKIHELALPEIHTTHRFVTPTPLPAKRVTEKSEVPLYNEHQSLPIKRVSDNSVVSLPSIRNADISEFYYTQEFNNLLKEFRLKVDIKSLPEIQDVLTILGTEDAEETLRAIREVAETPEGMELITSYLKGNDRAEDEFYNIYDDIGAGEIRVGNDDFNQNYIQPYTNEILQSDDASQYNYSPVEDPINATPASLSWWQKPLSWFGFYDDVKTVKTEKIKSDAEIIAKVVHDPDGFGGLSYTTKFLNPMGHRKEHEIDPPFKISGNEESRLISSEPFESPSTLPTIQMSEGDFERMVKELRLSPINPQTTTQKPQITTIQQTSSVDETTTKENGNFETIPALNDKETLLSDKIVSQSFELPINVAETFDIDIPDPQIPQKVNTATEQLETTRRSFEALSGPVRLSPIESRTGKVFRVDPEEVLKESKSIAADFEDDKEIVAVVSDLTEQSMKQQNEEEQD